MKKNIVLIIMTVVISVVSQESMKIIKLPSVAVDKVLCHTTENKNHVLFVNVDNALDEKCFREAVAAVSLAIPVNLAVTATNGWDGGRLFNKAGREKQFSAHTKLVVYVLNKPEMITFASAPYNWSMVNISGFNTNIPSEDQERYRRRLRQLMLKGLGLACGIGGNTDTGRCVMSSDSFSSETIDSTSATFSPYAYAPIEEALIKIGKEEIFQSAED